MKLDTKYHGTVEIQEKEILHFDQGIPGFPDERKFVTLPITDDASLLGLQSVLTSELAFVVTNPFQYYKEYDFTLEENVIEELHIESETDVKVLSILTVQDPFEKTTANLMAPIIINVKNNKGKQVILNNSNYQTKHPLFNVNAKVNTKG